MKREATEVTASLEDYLETIYFLNGQEEGVRVTDIAAQMNISKPSVNRAVNTLKTQGYVEHEHYGSLKLTQEGLKIARAVARRHMMLKRFLKEVLEVKEETAEEEACLIEHYLSAATIDKISEYMDRVLNKTIGEVES